MTTLSYREVLRAAHRLPPDAQAELATTLLRDLRVRFNAKRQANTAPLEPLHGMSTAELTALAEAVVAAGQQLVLQELLERNRSGTLTPDEEATLDTLLGQVDQIGLLKARARYTLSLGEPV